MNKPNPATSTGLKTLADDARALLAATAAVAGDKVGEARDRLAAALESGKEIAGRVRDQAVAGAKVADRTVRANPYKTIAIAAGIGALVGYLISRRCARKQD